MLTSCDWWFQLSLTQTEECVTMLVFNPSRMKDLRTGAKCLEEVRQNQVQAIEDEERARRQEILDKKAAAAKVRWPEIRWDGKKQT
jgi:hypothetical protein